MVPGSAHAVGMRHAVAGGWSRLAEGHPRGLALTRRSTPPTLPQGLLDGHFRPASLRGRLAVAMHPDPRSGCDERSSQCSDELLSVAAVLTRHPMRHAHKVRWQTPVSG